MTEAAKLRAQAAKCRRLAREISDERAALALNEMAHGYDAEALALEQAASSTASDPVVTDTPPPTPEQPPAA